MNRSTGKSPFQIVYGQNPKGVLDLVELPITETISDNAEAFAEHIHQLQEEVRAQLQENNSKYKAAADAHRREKIFQEGDLVMVHLRKERFPKGTYNKLKLKKIGPCRILEKRNNNAYKVGLPDNLDISPIFNVSDLYAFHGDDEDVEATTPIQWEQQVPKKKKERITQILDQTVFNTRHGSYTKYLVQWEGLSAADNTWVSEGEVKRIDNDKLQEFQQQNSQEQSSFQPEENDAPSNVHNF